MASEEDYEIISANDLRTGNYALLKGKTCKILEISRSKTGKHGGAKLHFVALDIFTRNKVVENINSTQPLDVPNVKKEDFPIVSIDGETLTVKLRDDTLQSDLKVPDVDEQKKIAAQLTKGETLVATVISALGKQAYDSFKRKYVK